MPNGMHYNSIDKKRNLTSKSRIEKQILFILIGKILKLSLSKIKNITTMGAQISIMVTIYSFTVGGMLKCPI